MSNPGFNPNMGQGPMPNPGFNPNMSQGPMPNPGFNPNMNQGPMPNPGFNPNMRPRPNNSGNNKGLIIGIVVVVVIAAIVGILFLTGVIGGKSTTCTMTQNMSGGSVVVTAKLKEKGDSTKEIVEYVASSSSKKFTQEDANTLESNIVVAFSSLDKLQHSSKVSNGKITVKITGVDDASFEDTKNDLILGGFSCK